MKQIEFVGVLLVVLVVVGTTVGVFAYEQVRAASRDCAAITMRTYEHGNPTPKVTRVKKGQEVCLRLTSYDVTHGFNIPDMGIYSDPIHPGKWTYVHFVPEEAGTYSFVCTIVCSPLHSRVRGQIIVEE